MEKKEQKKENKIKKTSILQQNSSNSNKQPQDILINTV
jgi:hypothetical protein